MKIHLDFEFLEDFFLSESNDIDDTRYNLKRLLCLANSPAELVIDFDLEEAYKDPEKKILLRQIAQKIPFFDETIISKANEPSFHETATPNLFFMNSTALNVAKFGCFTLTSKKIEEAKKLFRTERYRIDGKLNDWSLLEKCSMPCNSIILTDNYLFSNDETFENTFLILRKLMPKELLLDFDLTIIGFDVKKQSSDIREQHTQILKELKKHFSYKVNLTIIRENHHGRYIHTNYSRLFTEKGFSLFKNRRISASNETTLEFATVLEFGNETNLIDIRNKEIDKCRKINKVERMPDRLIGTRKNRLLT